MAKENAYWISPSGKIIPVAMRHINTIIDNPEKFNTNKKDIEKLYKKHGEPVGHEGEAREEIMLNLMKKGWIRARYIKPNDKWILQTFRLSNRLKDYIFDWASSLLKRKEINKYSEVHIMLDNGQDIITDVDDVVSFKAFESLDLNYKTTIVEIQGFEPDYVDIVGLYQ